VEGRLEGRGFRPRTLAGDGGHARGKTGGAGRDSSTSRRWGSGHPPFAGGRGPRQGRGIQARRGVAKRSAGKQGRRPDTRQSSTAGWLPLTRRRSSARPAKPGRAKRLYLRRVSSGAIPAQTRSGCRLENHVAINKAPKTRAISNSSASASVGDFLGNQDPAER